MVRCEAQTKCPRHDQSQTCCNTQFLSVLAETPRTGFPFIPSWVTGLWRWFSDNSCLGSSRPGRTPSRGNSSLIAPLSSWLGCGSKASNHSLWFGAEEAANPPRRQLIQGKACPRLAWLWKGLWDASPQIQSLPSPVRRALFNLNRLSHSLSSSINVCLDSSPGPHTQPEDQTCPFTLASYNPLAGL